MPSPVKIRASFQQDRAYLRRLQEAIERDDSRPLDWRKRTIGELGDVILSLESADVRRAEADKETRKAEEAARLHKTAKDNKDGRKAKSA